MQRTPGKLHKSPRLRWRIVNAGLYQAAKGVHMPLHRHTYWELVYYRMGAVDCLIEDQSRAGHIGLYWLTPPGVNHGERALTAYSCYWIALEDAATGDAPFFLDDDRHHAMEHICGQIVAEWGGRALGRNRMLRLLSEQMSCLLDRAASERILSLAEQTVLRAERWMEEQFGRPLTIRHVAREVGVSPSALRNYFHAVRGRPPRAHLQQVRLDKAIGFLRTSNLKLESVAELCGYNSASHLTRCVKTFARQTPGQIRARRLLG
jgi:AraC-like DNA-binding protein